MKPAKLYLFLFLFLLTPVVNAATVICKWKDNKNGVLCMEFADALASHSNFVVPNLLSRGLDAMFFVVPGNFFYGYGIMTWEALCNRTGLSLANHTLNHKSTIADLAEVDYEMGEAARIIWPLNPPGKSKLTVFGFSGSLGSIPAGWYELEQTYYCVDITSHSENRGERYTSFKAESSNATSAAMIAVAQRILSTGSWEAVQWHGVGPQAEYLSTPGDEFTAFLDYLVTVKDRIWITAGEKAYMYKQERVSSSVYEIESTASFIRINSTSTLDADLFRYPLTYITEVPAAWNYCKAGQSALDAQKIYPVDHWASSATVMFEAVPNWGEIRLESCSSMDTTAPGAPVVVRDGTGPFGDINVTTITTQISANWAQSSDAGSGIAKYWYKVGVTTGGSEIFDWIDNSTFTYFTTTRTNLALSRGVTYYVTVKAADGAGNESSPVCSNGQCVESVPGYISLGDDFESGSLGSWSVPSITGSNTIAVSALAAYEGNFGVKCHLQDNSAAVITKDITPTGNVFIRFNLNIAALDMPRLLNMGGDGNAWNAKVFSMMRLEDALGNLVATVYLGNTDTGINLYVCFIENVSSWQCMPAWPGQYYGYLPISTGTWHTIDLHVKADNNKTGGLEMWVDQVKVLSALRRQTPNANVGKIYLGATSIGSNNFTGDIYFDNVKISDTLLYTVPGSTPAVIPGPPDPPTPPRVPTAPVPDSVHAYPNPCKTISAANPVKFRLPGGTASGEAAIYTVSGRLIKRFSVVSGAEEITWDGTNTAGQKAGRGIYIYKLTSNNAGPVTGKIALTR
ncbi:MAG: hypothetical protein A2297_03690 [Elusimicrobia bacterium RIFOXYB2_FULL_48_7]|nr:MAG: hypothetical protein A2297_03690 [Elusimicrobia bacterium RIFOXYB2_FULL_48_7]